MHIREVTVSDAEAIAGLLASLGYPGCEEFIAAKIAAQVAHPDARLLVAAGDDGVAGFISLHFVPQIALAGDFCRISYFCVAEDKRGQGIGEALERAAAALAEERGCDRIEVHCHSRRSGAHRFYQRQGFAESPKYFAKAVG